VTERADALDGGRRRILRRRQVRAPQPRPRAPSRRARVASPLSLTMASRALLTFARPLRRAAPAARAYATARPVFPTTTPKRGAATSVTQAEIDAELLGGTPAPRAAPAAAASSSPAAPTPTETGFGEAVEGAPAGDGALDWSRSYHGLSVTPFPKESADVLLAPVDPRDVEIKPGPLPSLSPACNPPLTRSTQTGSSTCPRSSTGGS
jgi:hypothetical protein